MKHNLRITSPPGEIATPHNIKLMCGDEEVGGVIALSFSSFDVNDPKLATADFTCTVGVDMEVAVRHPPYKQLLFHELNELRKELCPHGCGEGHEPLADTITGELNHGFGPCPAAAIIRRMEML